MRKLEVARLLVLLPALLTGLFAASASWADSSYTPTEAEANKYTVEQATDFVQRGISICGGALQWKAQVMPDILILSAPGGFSIPQFRELHDIKLTFTDSSGGFLKPRVDSSITILMSGHIFMYGQDQSSAWYSCGGFGPGGGDWTKVLGDALLRLKLEYDKSNGPEAMAKFKEEALRYQAMTPKPALPEDARRFKVQAEAAVAAKQFLDAAEKYKKATEIAPWWPEAHFNRSVILAELQNFDSAMTEMKRYLLLKPDAPDARQAQDLIYVWETHPFRNK